MLSDRRIRALKPAPCDKWYCDGNGLYLRVRRTGGRSWVLRRKRGGHVEVITVGAWPALGLAQARLKAGALAGKDVSTLTLGALEETVKVTAESPLVDITSTRVGGNIGTQELSELPAMNRNFFAAVALLPGIQFSPSNQMGNDTIVSAGQTTQNNNVAVDGGYNADDALGTSAGAQVRTPLEAIQEFQVLTSMYDAEFGRASGAVINAITDAIGSEELAMPATPQAVWAAIEKHKLSHKAA